MGMYTATERLYLNSKGEVVKADDADRQSLLVAVGGQLPEERARELGLLDEAKADDGAEERATKAVTRAPANKAANT